MEPIMNPLIAHHQDYVQIVQTILEPGERAPQIPEETRRVPFQVYINGWLIEDQASPGDEVTIVTRIGRRLSGKLYRIDPDYTHTFGPQIQELIRLDFRTSTGERHG